jgi:DNA-directed RNA polymerase specialized sigma24 family protein
MTRWDLQQQLRDAREALDRADRDLAVAITHARIHGLTEDWIGGVTQLHPSTVRARYGRRITAKRVLHP